MESRMNHRGRANGRRNATRRTSGHRVPASRNIITAASPDFALVREVQMRATGANIHALAQLMQTYANAVECGAVLHAQAAEAKLRVWLAASR